MKYAFIAGSESGLAREAIRILIEEGYYILSADIAYKELVEEQGRSYIPLNVTSDESIISACEYVKSKTDELGLVSSFAGIVTLGSLVELPLDALDRIMTINCLCQYKINNLLFPLLMKGRGRIVTISSEYGVLDALPIHGFYGISKHALEAYNDSLRRETQKSGVKVICIRPGAFKTSMQASIETSFDRLIMETEMYKRILTKMKFLMKGELEKAKDPHVFGRTFRKAVFSKKPRIYYSVNNSFPMKLLSALPASLQDKVFRFFL